MTTFCHKGVAGGSKENLEDELNRDVAVEKRGMLMQAFSFSFMQPRLRFVSSYLTQLLNY